MYCPRCKNEYKCPCKNCKGKKWKWYKDDTQECLKCGLRKHFDWWAELEWDITEPLEH